MNSHLHNKMKETFEEVDVPNKEDIWNQIESRLEEDDDKKPLFWFRINGCFGGVLSFFVFSSLIASIALYHHYNLKNKNTNTHLEKNIPASKNKSTTTNIDENNKINNSSNSLTNNTTPSSNLSLKQASNKLSTSSIKKSSTQQTNKLTITSKNKNSFSISRNNNSNKNSNNVVEQNPATSLDNAIKNETQNKQNINPIFYSINYLNPLETNEFENTIPSKVEVKDSISSNKNPSKKYFIGISTGFAFNQKIVQENVSNSKVANGLFYFAKQMPLEIFGDIVLNKTITLQPSFQFIPYNFRDTSKEIYIVDSFSTNKISNELNRCYYLDIGLSAKFNIYKKLYVGTGVFLGCKTPVIGSKTTLNDVESFSTSRSKLYTNLNSFDVGINIKVGYNYKKWLFEANYKQGLLDANASKIGYQPKFSMIIGVGYRFAINCKKKN